MAFLKKSFLWIALLAAIGLWCYQYFVINALCARPIYYHIATFDTRFKVSQSDFLSAIDEASAIWEKALGRDLFSPSSKGTLDINLVYDDRQATAEKNKILTAQVGTTKQNADEIKSRFSLLEQKYRQAQTDYENLLSQFKQAQSDYNAEVSMWNSRGGAPKNEYEKINNEKAALASLQVTLESKRLVVNSLADEVNALIKKYNYLAHSVNETIDTINKDAGKEFEEGEFISDKDGERINVYEFGSRQVLVRVLAHEFGHALGLNHNSNPDSIMYYLNDSKNMKLTMNDVTALKEVCKIK